ncbi:MAG: hypothetical protein GY787_00675 [Alteromonadales bacterium]|nr:hypothetical protein [Alteromonadales bacterium]
MEIKEYIEKELRKLDKGIVATPTEEYLDKFAEANNGSNDFLLMQLAKNYGYKLALLNIKDKINE